MDDAENMFVDSKEILDNLSIYHFASYFMETRKNAQHKSAMSWMDSLDLDTIRMLIEYGEKLESNQKEAKPNTKTDLFDKPMLDEDVGEDEEGRYIQPKEADEGMELYALTILLLAWEHDQRAVPLDATEPSMFTLRLYANMQLLKRQSYITVKGNGTLLSSNTHFKTTAKGKKLGKKIAKAIAESKMDSEGG